MVITEQEEFQKFVYNHAKVNHYLFNFIHPDVWDTFKVNWSVQVFISINFVVLSFFVPTLLLFIPVFL